jgi:carbonic anhydrase
MNMHTVVKGLLEPGLGLVALMLVPFSMAAQGEESAAWSYEGRNGPEHWGQLDADYGFCSAGFNQSPVDLRDSTEAVMDRIRFHYDQNASVRATGVPIPRFNFAPGSRIGLGKNYDLKYLELHMPSEHRMRGREFPLEAQLVHADDDGRYVIVSVLFQAGVHNAVLDSLLTSLASPDDATPLDPSLVLPESVLRYFRYNGSLTTPPCTEGVTWLVMREQASISSDQLDQLRQTAIAGARPLQPLHARLLLQ